MAWLWQAVTLQVGVHQTEQMFKALDNARAELDPKMAGIRLSVLEISAPSFL